VRLQPTTAFLAQRKTSVRGNLSRLRRLGPRAPFMSPNSRSLLSWAGRSVC
jgi:hypothetical protein